MTTTPIGPAEIAVRPALLEAVAKWASTDGSRPHLCQVVFGNGEMVAVDGIRMVRIPLKTHGLSFGLARADALAAVAAHKLMGCRGTIRIRPVASARLEIRLQEHGDIPLLTVKAVTDQPPPFEEAMPKGGAAVPDGIWFNPRYMDAIADVLRAYGGGDGVRVTKWGGMLDPILFEGPEGSRFVIMPMREP